MIFTTSWDDGHPCDQRIAEILDRYGLSGSFYLPIRNCEGYPVMDANVMRELDKTFEIGSHTLDHSYLPNLTTDAYNFQIISGKHQLEDILGHTVGGFCYPGGKINGAVRQAVIDANFVYARGINNFWLNCGLDRFEATTTLQFYPHQRQVLWRNFVKGGHYYERFSVFQTVAVATDWLSAMKNVVALQAETDNVVHIWGHSWEIEKNDLWSQLDNFLKFVSEIRPYTSSVEGLFKRTEPTQGKMT